MGVWFRWGSAFVGLGTVYVWLEEGKGDVEGRCLAVSFESFGMTLFVLI